MTELHGRRIPAVPIRGPDPQRGEGIVVGQQGGSFRGLLLELFVRFIVGGACPQWQDRGVSEVEPQASHA